MKRLSVVGFVSGVSIAASSARAEEPVEEVPAATAEAPPKPAIAPEPATPPAPATPPKAKATTKSKSAMARTDAVAEDASSQAASEGFVLGGYAQGQYEQHQDSESQLRTGGSLYNLDRFAVRRARLKLEREFEFSSFMIELDGNTMQGPRLVLQHAELSAHYRGGHPPGTPPVFKLTFGLFDTPFGYENLESPRVRPFLERSLGSRAFFPVEPDVGVRVSGALGWFRYAAAIVNGEPYGTPYALRDPNKAKDYVLRVGGLAKPTNVTEISFGASLYNGKGFHPGTEPSKNSTVWRDLNENGQVDPGEITAYPGVSGEPSQDFNRWLVGGDFQLRFKTGLGWTSLFTEITLGSNMDRGLFVANPIRAGNINARELAWYAAIVQEIGTRGLIGFRTDYYDPNADLLDRQGGKLVPFKQAVRTFSPMVTWIFDEKARVIFQYDFVRDHFARDGAGLPTDLKNDAWTIRLQVQP